MNLLHRMRSLHRLVSWIMTPVIVITSGSLLYKLEVQAASLRTESFVKEVVEIEIPKIVETTTLANTVRSTSDTFNTETVVTPHELVDNMRNTNNELKEGAEAIVEANSYRVYVTDEELELMARLVHAEAGNQDLYGRRLVADVILNRVESDSFPNNIHDVIYETNQFSTASYLYSNTNTPTEDDYEAVRLELESRVDTEVYFFRTDYYHSFGTPLYIHGDHYFSTL